MKERKWEDRINGVENKIKEWVDWLNQKMEQIENRGWGGARWGEGGGRSRSSEEEDNGSGYTYSRRGSSVVSSRFSEGKFSEREVKVITKWVTGKDREERKCNIVIKGGGGNREDKGG